MLDPTKDCSLIGDSLLLAILGFKAKPESIGVSAWPNSGQQELITSTLQRLLGGRNEAEPDNPPGGAGEGAAMPISHWWVDNIPSGTTYHFIHAVR
jgi:hypothetical protein